MIIEAKGLMEARKMLVHLKDKQIPFAASRTVNTLGWMVQRDTVDRLLPSKFILRNDWYRPGRKTGVNLFKSNKKQNPIQATVDTRAPFMVMQEEGGTKKPKAGHNFTPVPTKNAQPDKLKVTPYHNRYSSLVRTFKNRRSKTIKVRGSFWVKFKSSKHPIVAIREGKGPHPVKFMHMGFSSIKVKPRFGFTKNAQGIIDKNFNEVWYKEFAYALATAL